MSVMYLKNSLISQNSWLKDTSPGRKTILPESITHAKSKRIWGNFFFTLETKK